MQSIVPTPHFSSFSSSICLNRFDFTRPVTDADICTAERKMSQTMDMIVTKKKRTAILLRKKYASVRFVNSIPHLQESGKKSIFQWIIGSFDGAGEGFIRSCSFNDFRQRLDL